MSTLIIRADAGATIGMGHLMRCLTLADVWQSTGRSTVVLAAGPVTKILSAVTSQLRQFIPTSEQWPHPADLEQTITVISSCTRRDGEPPWVIADGYSFDEPYYRRLRESGARLLVIDDSVRLRHYAADVVLNQNPGAERLDYQGDPDTQLLLGGRYTMLRAQVLARAARPRAVPEIARRILVIMGAADPSNASERVIRALNRVRVSKLEATVVVGPLNPWRDRLEAAARSSAVPVNVSVTPPDLPELIAEADLAVSAAGSTTWELLFLGVPTVLSPVADNQQIVVEAIRDASAAEVSELEVDALAECVERLCHDSGRRLELGARARGMVDGKGASRVLACIGGTATEPFARLRRARASDVRRLWEISNDPDVRRYAFQSEPIAYEHHVQWFSTRLSSPDTVMWVLDTGSEIAGQIRYDRSPYGAAVISFSVASGWRNRGIGVRLLASTWRRACDVLGVDRVRGVTFVENEPSLRAFRAAGFNTVGTQLLEGRACHVCERSPLSEEARVGIH